jgi:hypothetical protein
VVPVFLVAARRAQGFPECEDRLMNLNESFPDIEALEQELHESRAR